MLLYYIYIIVTSTNTSTVTSTNTSTNTSTATATKDYYTVITMFTEYIGEVNGGLVIHSTDDIKDDINMEDPESNKHIILDLSVTNSTDPRLYYKMGQCIISHNKRMTKYQLNKYMSDSNSIVRYEVEFSDNTKMEILVENEIKIHSNKKIDSSNIKYADSDDIDTIKKNNCIIDIDLSSTELGRMTTFDYLLIPHASILDTPKSTIKGDIKGDIKGNIKGDIKGNTGGNEDGTLDKNVTLDKYVTLDKNVTQEEDAIQEEDDAVMTMANASALPVDESVTIGGSIPRNDDVSLLSSTYNIFSHLGSASICKNDKKCPECPCSDDKIMTVFRNYLSSEQSLGSSNQSIGTSITSTNYDVLSSMLDKFDENDELSLLNNSEVVNLLKRNNIDIEDAKKAFKPPGPRGDTTWLSNYDIHAVLDWFKEQYKDFNYYPCSLMDFDDAKGPKALISVKKVTDFIKEGYTKVACVLNTAKGNSSGEHWVTVYSDVNLSANKATLEYFNSTGESPPKEVIRWMKRNHEALNEYFSSNNATLTEHFTGDRVVELVNTTSMQQGNSECGVYALYFIKSRLEGMSFQEIVKSNVIDNKMFTFRTFLFSPGNSDDSDSQGGWKGFKKRNKKVSVGSQIATKGGKPRGLSTKTRHHSIGGEMYRLTSDFELIRV